MAALQAFHRIVTLKGSARTAGGVKVSVEAKVKQIIFDKLGGDEVAIIASASFVDDLGADSLDRVELIMALEEEFNLEIPDEQAEQIKTVRDAVDYVEKNSKSVRN